MPSSIEVGDKGVIVIVLSGKNQFIMTTEKTYKGE